MIMDNDSLKSILIKEGYPNNSELDKTINRLLNLEGESKDMLIAWLSYHIQPDFEPINGISSALLRVRVGMKAPAIILAFDMLVRFPDSVVVFNKLINRNVIYKSQ